MRHFFAFIILAFLLAPSVTLANSIDKSALQSRISKARKNIVRCYTNGLRRNPTLKGKVVVKFSIAKGRVDWARITETELNDENVEACLVSEIQRLRFPDYRRAEVVIVTYPFKFQPPNP